MEKQRDINKTNTNPEPNSVYGLAKTTAYYTCKMYCKVYKLHICGAIFLT